MNILEAIEEMKKGKTVKRPNSSDVHFYVNHVTLGENLSHISDYQLENGSNISIYQTLFNSMDVLSNDWEIYELPKSK